MSRRRRLDWRFEDRSGAIYRRRNINRITRACRKCVHCPDESLFLFHNVDGKTHIWGFRSTVDAQWKYGTRFVLRRIAMTVYDRYCDCMLATWLSEKREHHLWWTCYFFLCNHTLRAAGWQCLIWTRQINAIQSAAKCNRNLITTFK